MSWFMILFIVLVVALIGSAPAWPHSRGWGYLPSAVLLIATILVGLKVFGAI
jgi:hypothetical protein